MQLIPHIIFISTITVGTHLAVKEWLWTLRIDDERILGTTWKFILKPLFACPTCMASIHGTAWHFIFGGTVETWIPVCLALAFTNTLLNKWVN